MKSLLRSALALLAVAAVVACFLHSDVIAGGNKALMKQIDDLATAIEKGDTATAEKLAKKIAKDQEEVYEPMLTLKPRDKKGFGIGKTPDKHRPDGIELHLRELAKEAPSKIKLDNARDDYKEMAYRTAAIAKIAHILAPKGGGGQKTPDNWRKMSKEMHDAAVELGKIAKGGTPEQVHKAAEKLNNNCNNCHAIFR
jgi:hypothetical protein